MPSGHCYVVVFTKGIRAKRDNIEKLVLGLGVLFESQVFAFHVVGGLPDSEWRVEHIVGTGEMREYSSSQRGGSPPPEITSFHVGAPFFSESTSTCRRTLSA